MKLEICDKLQFNKSKFFSSHGKISISMIIIIILYFKSLKLSFKIIEKKNKNHIDEIFSIVEKPQSENMIKNIHMKKSMKISLTNNLKKIIAMVCVHSRSLLLGVSTCPNLI